MKQLVAIQSALVCQKNQNNKFGNYNYRSCEDILEALKPLLEKHDATLTVRDEVKQVENVPQMIIVDESTKPKKKQLVTSTLIYIEATATFTCDGESVSVTAQAGVDVNKAGMDIAQCFGSSSSYARKYALNGLFLIDDTKDADATNDHGKGQLSPTKQPPNNPPHEMYNWSVDFKNKIQQQINNEGMIALINDNETSLNDCTKKMVKDFADTITARTNGEVKWPDYIKGK